MKALQYFKDETKFNLDLIILFGLSINFRLDLEPFQANPALQVIPYHLESMAFGTELDGSEDFFQMFWPTVMSHKIGEMDMDGFKRERRKGNPDHL